MQYVAKLNVVELIAFIASRFGDNVARFAGRSDWRWEKSLGKLSQSHIQYCLARRSAFFHLNANGLELNANSCVQP
jgi:hypothetical protein